MIQLISYEYKLSKNKKNSTLPVVTKKGIVVGWIEIDHSTFPKGTIISIGNPKQNPEIENDGNECNSSKKKQGSPLLEINSSKQKKNENEFDPPVKINLVTQLKDSSITKLKDLCISFSNDPNEKLKCLESKTKIEEELSKKEVIVSNEVTHFTTFAVLFSSSSGNECDSWIWKTSIALVGFAIVFSLFALILTRNKRFVAWISGYRESKRVSNLMIKANFK